VLHKALVMNSKSTSRELQSEDRNVCFPWFSSNSGPEGSPDKEVKKEKEEKEKNATPPILIETGQYTSIVLAAFGAIRIDVGTETAKAHPFFTACAKSPIGHCANRVLVVAEAQPGLPCKSGHERSS